MKIYKPNKDQIREYQKKMEEIEDFCIDHNISHSMSYDSYYFEVRGQAYRVSNHSIEASNKGAYDEFGRQIRDLYHGSREKEITYIHASKTRIIDIYNDLVAGKKLDGRGNIK